MKSTTLPVTCDTYDQPVLAHEDAFVQWDDKNDVISQVKTVHSLGSSSIDSCFQNLDSLTRKDLELKTVLEQLPELRSQLKLA